MASELVKIPFYGDELDAVQDVGGKVWVSLRRCCENLGLDAEGQRKKLKAKAWACTEEKSVQLPGDTQSRSVAMIDLDTLPGWLFSIDARKVKEQIREKLARYQREAARVLADHFYGRKAAPPAESDPILSGLAMVIETRRRQIEIERAQAEMVRMCAEALRLSSSAETKSQAALHQSTANHGHFAVLAYARLRGWEMPVARAAAHGRRLSALCAARGIPVGHMSDPRFGVVNTYPESILDEHFAAGPE